jgi:hypothetical protein
MTDVSFDVIMPSDFVIHDCHSTTVLAVVSVILAGCQRLMTYLKIQQTDEDTYCSTRGTPSTVHQSRDSIESMARRLITKYLAHFTLT